MPNVLNAIPSFIRDQVLGYIDDHIIKSLYQTVPFAQNLTSMLDDLATITTKFELVTNLELPVGDAIGDSQASHTFAGVAYTWNDKRNVINAPDVLKTLEKQSVTANAVSLEKRSPELESARLKLGDHKFNVPIGSFAVLAADKLVRRRSSAPRTSAPRSARSSTAPPSPTTSRSAASTRSARARSASTTRPRSRASAAPVSTSSSAPSRARSSASTCRSST